MPLCGHMSTITSEYVLPDSFIIDCTQEIPTHDDDDESATKHPVTLLNCKMWDVDASWRLLITYII